MNQFIVALCIPITLFSSLTIADYRSDFEEKACSNLQVASLQQPTAFQGTKPSSTSCTITSWGDDHFSISYGFRNVYLDHRFLKRQLTLTMTEEATTSCVFTSKYEWSCSFKNTNFSYVHETYNLKNNSTTYELLYDISTQERFNKAILTAISQSNL